MSDLNQSKSNSLKPCPFCGGEAEVYEYEASRDIYDSHTLGYVDTEYFTKYGCGCHKCGCIIGEKNSEEQAIEAWNRREPIDKVVEQLEELRNLEERTDRGYCPDDDTECRHNYSDLGCTHCAFEKAIEIVRKGGVDAKQCEADAK